MDLLVLIFGIIGWIYNCRPLLKATLIISICGLLLSLILIGIEEIPSLCDYISLLIFIAGIISSLVRMLRQLK